MALTTLATCRLVPSMRSAVKISDAWLNQLISAADSTIKEWCKQNLELRSWEEHHSGNEQTGLILRQYPVWSGTTQIAAGSNGVALPTATINVETTNGPDGLPMFDPAGRSGEVSPCITVQTGTSSWTTVTYTGITSTSFTGCSGGTGTLSSTDGLNSVSQPSVWIDFSAYWGQRPLMSGVSDQGPFNDQTLQINGVNFGVNLNRTGQRAKSGILTRVGGYSAGGWIGYPTQLSSRGKLSAYRMPCWPRGTGNIKVHYSAGYSTVPADLTYAATTLVSRMVQAQPQGYPLQSESLGAYSYSILAGGDTPDVGEVRSILARYKEVSW